MKDGTATGMSGQDVSQWSLPTSGRYTLSQLAKLLGMTERALREALKEHGVPIQPVTGHVWIVDMDDFYSSISKKAIVKKSSVKQVRRKGRRAA